MRPHSVGPQVGGKVSISAWGGGGGTVFGGKLQHAASTGFVIQLVETCSNSTDVDAHVRSTGSPLSLETVDECRHCLRLPLGRERLCSSVNNPHHTPLSLLCA
jgi:hypothetical protein